MKKVQAKALHIILTLLFPLLLLFMAFFGGQSFTVYAATGSTVEAFEARSVLTDLEGSDVNGKPFDLEDYPQDEHGTPQIISFVEFGYAAAFDRPDLGYYVYVYNPQQIIFNDGVQSKVQMKFGRQVGYDKYPLELLNYTTAPGYEGRFYKFKIALSAEQLAVLQSFLEEAKRVYEITGFELSEGRTVTEYKCMQKFTYTGYAAGYGVKDTDESTLACTADGIDKYLELDVHHTYFRPEGTNGKNYYTSDSLSTAYFAIPKKYDEEYGVMTRIRGEYLKALSSDIFVTGNSTYYNRFLSVLGQDVGLLVPGTDDFEAVIYTLEKAAGWTHWSGTWSYNLPTKMDKADAVNPEKVREYIEEAREDGTRVATQLAYVLEATNGDADTYNLPSEELKAYMEWYSTEGPGKDEEKILDRYAASLFEWVDEEMTVFDLSSDDMTRTLFGDTAKAQNFWQRLFGTKSTETRVEYGSREVIHKLEDEDFIYKPGMQELNTTQTSLNLLVAESDCEELLAYYEAHKEDYVVYLVRYAVDDYYSAEATEGMFDGWFGIMDGVLTPTYGGFKLKSSDTNCWLAQEYFYLNWDVMDVTLTKNDVSTVIPVMMSPIDVIHDATHPTVTRGDWPAWATWLIVAVVALVVVIVLFIVFPPVLQIFLKAVKWIVMLPVKAVRAISKAAKKRKRKSKPKSKTRAKSKSRSKKK